MLAEVARVIKGLQNKCDIISIYITPENKGFWSVSTARHFRDNVLYFSIDFNLAIFAGPSFHVFA